MRLTTAILLFFFIIISVKAQVTNNEKTPEQIYKYGYQQSIQKGTYLMKSLDSGFIENTKSKIEGSIIKDSAFLNSLSCMYLAIEEPIALFSKMGNVTQKDVAGILETSTLVDVDSIFYNTIYIDSEEAPMTIDKWYDLVEKNEDHYFEHPLVYDVWYAININGKKYYTDYKLHDLIEKNVYIPSKDQILLICSQSTGYDGMYDVGYPDYYYIVILDKNNKGWSQIYRSEQFDLNNGGADEYGLSEIDPKNILEKGDNIEIDFYDYFTLVWTGKSITIKMTEPQE